MSRIEIVAIGTCIFSSIVFLAGCNNSLQKNSRPKIDRNEIVKINTELGLSYMQNNQFSDAEEKLNKALRINPRNTDTLNAMALLKSKTNQQEEAIYYFRKAIKLDSSDPAINNNYGQYLCAIGSHKEGIYYLKIAIKNYEIRNKTIAYFNAGICAAASGDLDYAASNMTNALNIDESYGPALLELSSLMIKIGNYNEAELLLGRFNKLSKATASSLYNAYLISEKKGYINESKKLKILLKNLFPLSEEFKKINEKSQ